MSKREFFLRYVHILDKLRKAPATFEQIDHYLSQQSQLQDYCFNISKRQFMRDLNDISAIFEVEIAFDHSRQAWFICEDEYSEITRHRMEAFDTFNALKMGENTSKSIHFEKCQPRGTENLFPLLHAIKNNLETGFVYSKFRQDKPTRRTAQPYALKEFKNRWYVIAKDTKDSVIKSFALDRLSQLQVLNSYFLPPVDFDLDNQYRHSFGIISPKKGQRLEKVILSFHPVQGKYIKSMPMHESQVIIRDDEKELLISLTLYITLDFLMEILSFGEKVKVIKPLSLINTLKASYARSLNQYS
jgi:predicted DNA-binding transcriptional regulator YafY